MKHAYLHKNFRNLSFEKKLIFLSHAFTLIFCFFPWFSASPVYIDEFFYNAFEGPTYLIGMLVFLISFLIFLLFLDRLFEKQKVTLSFSENILYFVCGAQQILLLVLAWSVLMVIGREFENHEIRFGISVIFILQVIGLVATFLNYQINQQKKVKQFFKHPNKKEDENKEAKNLFSSK